MTPINRPASGRFDRMIDSLATPAGILLVLALLVGGCISAGISVYTASVKLQQDHEVFRDRQAKNGYVAMSDVQRLILTAQEAFRQGGLEGDLRAEFSDDADIIYVRIDNFERMTQQQEALPSGTAAIAALRDVLQIADAAVASDDVDVDRLLADLIRSSAIARHHLVQFLDDMRRNADAVLDSQSDALLQQRAIVIASLLGLTLVGGVGLLLLRREVVARRARETAEERVDHLAFFDQLTGLPNRAQFQTRLEAMLAREQGLALIYVDLDGFKNINDTYGHAAGDHVLVCVGRALQAVAHDHLGFAARLGGDEFALVLPTEDRAELTRTASEILTLSDAACSYEGEVLNYGLSIGLATSAQVSASMGLSLDVLSRVADFALYEAKQGGRGRFVIYDTDVEEKFAARKSMIEDMPKAIANGDLEVFLQPKFQLENRSLVGFEALVRWRRGDKLVPPSDFILIAEESGQVAEIDRYVLHRAATVIAAWNEANGTEFGISVNLSTLHFSTQRIVHFVQETLAASGLPSHLLTLEITESTEMRDWTTARAILTALKDLGARVSIDDFGTGYSSLAYLRSTSADELKIDRSLVEEIETSRKAKLLLASVLDIARNMDLSVVVEGVETEQQADILRGLGVRYVQGFLFGRPSHWRDALAKTKPDAAA